MVVLVVGVRAVMRMRVLVNGAVVMLVGVRMFVAMTGIRVVVDVNGSVSVLVRHILFHIVLHS